jgi:cell division septum initiation protein DivIVA
MSQHAEPPRDAPEQQLADPPDAGPPRPNFSGDLDELLRDAPAFRRRLLGYDQLQVDNYVAWAEARERTAREETADLLDRYGRCWSELEEARQVLVHSSEGQQMAHVTERISSMLQLAADEAAEITATARTEAERLRSEARTAAERLRSEAQSEADGERQRAEQAAAAREQAELDAAELAKRSAEERDRLDEEAAAARARLDAEAAQVRERLDLEAAECRDREAAAAAASIRQQFETARKQFETARQQWEAAEVAARQRLARVEDELAELERRREASRVALTRMSHQVNEAVAALAETFPVPGLRLAPRSAENGAVPGGPPTARHHARARGETAAP